MTPKTQNSLPSGERAVSILSQHILSFNKAISPLSCQAHSGHELDSEACARDSLRGGEVFRRDVEEGNCLTQFENKAGFLFKVETCQGTQLQFKMQNMYMQSHKVQTFIYQLSGLGTVSMNVILSLGFVLLTMNMQMIFTKMIMRTEVGPGRWLSG